jgi:Cytochrome c554 and c-prime
MTTITRRGFAAIALAWVVAFSAGVAVRGEETQDPTDRGTAPGPTKLTPYIYGARHCGSCHDQRNNGKMSPDEINGLICRMVEFPIYDTLDKHKFAYSALTGDRAKEMTRLLGYDVKTRDDCLNCHSTADRDKPKQSYARETDGITCVACHGAVAEWVEIHQRTDNRQWRDLSRKKKEDRFGMIDLWSPVRRAEKCGSCHIGSHAEGKVVTHTMYAAGHPPLPSFETATFSEAQPRHWESLAEKTPERRNRLNPVRDRRNLDQSQLVVVSGLVALRESIKLFAEQSAARDQPDASKDPWPDFARYDCAGCHHDLRADAGASWRQLRRRGSDPGRPRPPEWPLVLVPLAIAAADPREATSHKTQLKLHLEAFQQSLMARPFGDPDLARSAAESVVRWATPLIEDLDHAIVDAAKARKLLQTLCTMAGDTVPDYDSARQIAWAFRIIYHESMPDRDPLIDHILADLETELDLSLPPTNVQAPIVPSLADRLRRIADFDPAPFQAHFKMIAERLAAMPPVHEARR